jgi:hypothetical protein
MPSFSENSKSGQLIPHVVRAVAIPRQRDRTIAFGNTASPAGFCMEIASSSKRRRRATSRHAGTRIVLAFH